MEGKDNQGVWGEHVHTAILKWITNKDLLYSTENSAQCYVPAWMGGEFGGEWIHGWRNPFTVHLKLSQHCLLKPQYDIKKFLNNHRTSKMTWADTWGNYIWWGGLILSKSRGPNALIRETRKKFFGKINYSKIFNLSIKLVLCVVTMSAI